MNLSVFSYQRDLPPGQTCDFPEAQVPPPLSTGACSGSDKLHPPRYEPLIGFCLSQN